MYCIDENMEVDNSVYELTLPKRRRWFRQQGNIRISKLFFDIELVDNIYDINGNSLMYNYNTPVMFSTPISINFKVEFSKDE